IQPDEIAFKNKTDKLIYDYIQANGFITSAQVLDITRINTTQGANVALGRLINADLVVMERKGKHVIYRLKEEL
ncbi:MAG: AAA family ATPase, partial [Abditibacteriota bacterium]|nr:AAA family ATPase [Abditibacteriota bacterium]